MGQKTSDEKVKSRYEPDFEQFCKDITSDKDSHEYCDAENYFFALAGTMEMSINNSNDLFIPERMIKLFPAFLENQKDQDVLDAERKEAQRLIDEEEARQEAIRKEAEQEAEWARQEAEAKIIGAVYVTSPADWMPGDLCAYDYIENRRLFIQRGRLPQVGEIAYFSVFKGMETSYIRYVSKVYQDTDGRQFVSTKDDDKLPVCGGITMIRGVATHYMSFEGEEPEDIKPLYAEHGLSIVPPAPTAQKEPAMAA